MHTTVHAPQTKDHALIFGPKNQRVIILNGHDPNRAADFETLYACAVAESILTRPRTKKAWSPKIGGNDLEPARWELSPTGTEWNMRGFAYSTPDRNVYLWSCAGGDSIPLMGEGC